MQKPEKIVVASHNQGKIEEIKTMLSPFGIEAVSAAELNLPDVEETGATFEENARLKAETLSGLCNLPCLADDSGLCVNVLGGNAFLQVFVDGSEEESQIFRITVENQGAVT